METHWRMSKSFSEQLLVNIGRLYLLRLPLGFELGRSEIAQRGVDMLVHIDPMEKDYYASVNHQL